MRVLKRAARGERIRAYIGDRIWYVNAQEWTQLAEGINASIYRHHYCHSAVAMVPMVVTCAVCFCPLVYVGMQMRPRVNADIAKMHVASELNARGITLDWSPATKFDQGGLTFTCSAIPVQQAMG